MLSALWPGWHWEIKDFRKFHDKHICDQRHTWYQIPICHQYRISFLTLGTINILTWKMSFLCAPGWLTFTHYIPVAGSHNLSQQKLPLDIGQDCLEHQGTFSHPFTCNLKQWSKHHVFYFQLLNYWSKILQTKLWEILQSDVNQDKSMKRREYICFLPISKNIALPCIYESEIPTHVKRWYNCSDNTSVVKLNLFQIHLQTPESSRTRRIFLIINNGKPNN